MRRDTYFDGLASTLGEHIYGSSKGHIRLEVLWTDLVNHLHLVCERSR
jgi:hypothetical protein